MNNNNKEVEEIQLEENNAVLEEEQVPQAERCYSCHHIHKPEDLTFSCNHHLCLKCSSMTFMIQEFKDITYDNITLKCYCGKGTIELPLQTAFSLFIAPKRKQKKCLTHSIEVECYCENCQIWLCSQCKSIFHDKQMPQHKTVPKKPKTNNICRKHHQPHEVYCEQCTNELCFICIRDDQAHSSFHTSIEKQYPIIKEEILGQLTRKSSGEVYKIIDKAEEKYKGYLNKNHTQALGKIQSIIKTLNATLLKLKEQHEKEESFADFFFKMMKSSYKYYFTSINDTKSSLNLLTILKNFKRELKDMTIEQNTSSEIDKMLFEMNNIIKKRTVICNPSFMGCNANRREGEGGSHDVSLTTFKTCHEEFLTSMCQLESGIVCTGSVDTSIRIFQLNQDENALKIKSNLTGHQGGIVSLCNADFGRLVSSSTDRSIKVWNVSNDQCSITIDFAYDTEINDLIYKGLDEIIACGDRNILKVFNVKDGNLVNEFKDETMENTDCVIKKLLYVQEKEALITAGSDGSLTLWDSNYKSVKTVSSRKLKSIESLVKISSDYIAVGTQGNSIVVFNIDSLEIKFDLVKHTNWVTSFTSIPNHQILASGDRDNTIILWDTSITPYKYIKSLSEHSNSILFLCPTPTNNLLSCSPDTILKLWKLS